jgi:hypothetical protein
MVAGLIMSFLSLNPIAADFPKPGNIHFGTIASVNNDWILSGHWVSSINKKDLTDANFFSIFNMVMTNGSSPHIHKISNATVNNVFQQGNNTVFNGTVSITMKDGPVDNVPTKVTIANNRTIAISIDPSKTGNHFGDSPIYGLINNYKDAVKMIKTIIEDSPIVKKLMPSMKTGIMQNMENWKDHFSMMKGHDNMTSNNMSIMDYFSMMNGHDNMTSNAR